MNDLTWKYIAFVVAVSILIWAVMQLNHRLQRHKRTDSGSLDTWIKLDATSQNTVEGISSDVETDDQEEAPEPDMHVRAKQNGHYSGSKKNR